MPITCWKPGLPRQEVVSPRVSVQWKPDTASVVNRQFTAKNTNHSQYKNFFCQQIFTFVSIFDRSWCVVTKWHHPRASQNYSQFWRNDVTLIVFLLIFLKAGENVPRKPLPRLLEVLPRPQRALPSSECEPVVGVLLAEEILSLSTPSFFWKL